MKHILAFTFIWIIICPLKSQTAPRLKQVSRNEVGLETSYDIDLAGKGLNSQILYLISVPKNYDDSHFSNGIHLENEVIIISPRFKGSIFSGLAMGGTRQNVVEVLGGKFRESKSNGGHPQLFYSSNGISILLLFNSRDELVLAAFKRRPQVVEDSNTILKTIIEGANNFEDLNGFLDQNSEIDKYFNRSSINGGGLYVESDLGITVTSFYESSEIKIYNNFNGYLYDYVEKGGGYKIEYTKKDFQQELIEYALMEYSDKENGFSGAPKSPNGTYTLNYIFNTGLSYYFIIRKNDFSERDTYVYGNRAINYKWLNDNYFALIDDIEGRCFVVNRNGKENAVDLAQSMNLDTREGFDFGLVTLNYFILKSGKDKKNYKIGFRELDHKLSMYQIKNIPDKIFSDMTKWEHPVKAVIAAEKLELYKVELYESSTYPVFYVRQLNLQNVNNITFLNQMAKQNSYWSFEIKDKNHQILVKIDKKSKKIIKVTSDLLGN